ncbi:CMRF35-like molecule 1 isoform X1 [Alosa alosa]|uniref:CMRF35-like molecule 1 isoform X1 n=1 Tax=Alosa alosa TaxID=278164 RepID=UPI0020151885|nr:CMRF35-like molecule 1 isoform X1 [Alosa alosa]
MKNLIVLLIYLISCSYEDIIKETGPLAGVVTIKCPYDAQHVDRHKYFCKGAGCDIIVSDKESRQRTSQRLKLTDHKQGKNFLVTMTNLTGEDTGVYWCAAGGASPSETPDLLMEVHIQVNPVIGDVGDSATFRCPYAEGSQNKSKCLCKGECEKSGDNCLIKSEQGQTQAKNGHETLYDDTVSRVFNVTIGGLRAEYSGKYTCAVITEVNFVTTEQELLVREVVAGDEGKSVIITCKYQHDQTSKNTAKYFCRAKDTGCKLEDFLVSSLAPNHNRYILKEDKDLQPEISARIFNVTITDLRAEDSGIYWCGVEETKSVVRLEVIKTSTNVIHIPDKSTTWPSSPASMSMTPVTISTSPGASPLTLSVSLIVVMVVVATAVFLLYRHKRNKTQELPSNDTNTRRNSQVPQPDCMYEEIKDTHNPSLPETNTVYATAQLPTMPSDDLTYSTATLPTNPCTDMGYSAVSFGEGPNTVAIAFRQGNCEYSRTSSDQ